MNKVRSMRESGKDYSEIYKRLRGGYNATDINEAAEQSDIEEPSYEERAPGPGLRPSIMEEDEEPEKRPTPRRAPEVENPLPPPTPSKPKKEENEEEEEPMREEIQTPPVTNEMSYGRGIVDDVEALVESVIEEKWNIMIERFGNLEAWRERVRMEIGSLKQELLRVQGRFENLEKAILGKITEYDKNIVNVGSEMKALEEVLKRILKPLTINIKELNRITKELKGKKKF